MIWGVPFTTGDWTFCVHSRVRRAPRGAPSRCRWLNGGNSLPEARIVNHLSIITDPAILKSRGSFFGVV